MLPNLTRRAGGSPFPGGDTPDTTTEISPFFAAPAGAAESPYHHADLSPYAIGKAIPVGSRRFRDQIEALAVALSEPALADVREDFRANLVAVYRVLVLHASWGGKDCFGFARAPRCVSAPTRARICQLVGGRKPGTPLAITTYKKCVRWWRRHGYLGVARKGWTPSLRAASLNGPDDHNVSQAFVLCGPRRRLKASPAVRDLLGNSPVDNPVDNVFVPDTKPCGKPEKSSEHDHGSALKRPLTLLRSSREKNVSSHAREEDQNRAPKTKGKKPRKRGAERVSALRTGLFADVTDGWWTHITWRFERDGWSGDDLLRAVDRMPDGTWHWQTRSVTTPEWRGGSARLLLWRLSHWLDDDGNPLPSPSQQAAARARAAKAARERQDAELGLSALSAKRRAQYPGLYETVRPEDIPPPRRAEAPRTPGAARPRPKGAAGRPGAAQAPHSAVPAPDHRPGSAISTDPAWDDLLAASAAAVQLAERDPAFAEALEHELESAEAEGRDPQWRVLLELATASTTTETEASE